MMKRIFCFLLAAAIVVPFGIIGLDMAGDPGADQRAAPVANMHEQVERGRYLALAGNCMTCHTVRGGKEYAGTRAIRTPFGDIYSSNITPDPETGIGKWTPDDFWRALHIGKSKDGSFLYPAFPYPNFTRVSRADSDAMFAFIKTIAPMKQANKNPDLRFPFNYRILLPFWRALYFRPGALQVESDGRPDWNRGAYLVQGLGHCSACHTSRNALGGTVADNDLAGGMIPMLNWYASSLTSDTQTALGNWGANDIEDLLQTGVSKRGAVFGPMAEVVGSSLQHLTGEDIHAMSVYLKSIPVKEGTAKPQSATVSAAQDAILKQGGTIYEKHCAECHGAGGQGAPPAYPALAGNRSLMAASPINPIRIMLSGGFPPTTKGNPRPYGMPPFGSALSDIEIAAVVSYIRTAWGNNGTLVSPIDVSRFRGAPIE